MGEHGTMIFQLLDFPHNSGFYMYTTMNETYDYARKNKLNYIFFNEEQKFLEINGFCYEPSDQIIEAFQKVLDGDVLQIGNNLAYVYFSGTSGENTLFITNHCNSNCVMCPEAEISRRNDNDPSIESLFEAVDYIPCNTNYLILTGGEPCLKGITLFELIRKIRSKRKDISIHLLSNGRAFCSTTYANELMDSSNGDCLVGIPLYGATKEKHDAITSASGSFEQTVEGIKNLLKRNIKVEIRIVVSKLNYQFMTELATFIANEFSSVYFVRFMALEMLGNAAKNSDKVWIPYGEAFNHSKEAIRILVEHGINVSLYNFPLCTVDKNYWTLCEKSISSYKIRYIEECEQCTKKDSCGGIFDGTKRFMKGYVKPYND